MFIDEPPFGLNADDQRLEGAKPPSNPAFAVERHTTLGKLQTFPKLLGKNFRNWVVKDLDPISQVRTIKKRYRNIAISFSHDSVTTGRLKTYSVHLGIGAHWARDQMGGNRQGRQKNKRSREPRPTLTAEEQEITEG
ncbi:hypothetical protein TNCV_2726401 [Trichonephila clavipes]|nr:hypothetical protein TNCV_2726401 [Trichonephila clavipes]